MQLELTRKATQDRGESPPIKAESGDG
ncbi:hypothetical protein CCACVL1_22231 [Corchorus capsularis]|uniref:Uncharacterized protein n=1 Tax=Corchorus capsularis TaxID=210143 RepID=A0A1R3H0Q9_COCAP|nr:hypothetical protein CCACVL1_22231 [Corchorus capsularis]